MTSEMSKRCDFLSSFLSQNLFPRYFAIRDNLYCVLKLLFSNYKHLKLKIRMSLTSYTVTMGTCYTMKEIIACLTMTGHLFDVIIVASTDNEL